MGYLFIGIAIIAVIIILVLAFKNKGQIQEKHNINKGATGEKIVSSILGGTKKGTQYQIDDLIITRDDGMTSQIDHVFINRNGIWAIETKNYAGMIFGTETQQEWIQTLDYGRVKNHFYNPVKQNETHIYWLDQILQPKHDITSLVVFVDADISHVSAMNVISSRSLKRFVNQNYGFTLGVEEMEHYYYKLKYLKDNNHVSLDEHIDNIHKMQDNLEHNICPRCGGKLVIRQGKNGYFYGCSNYPKCKFKKPLN